MAMRRHFNRPHPTPELTQPEPKKTVDERAFDFATRPAKDLSTGQRALQGLLILATLVAGIALFAAGSFVVSGIFMAGLPVLAIVAVLGLIVAVLKPRGLKG